MTKHNQTILALLTSTLCASCGGGGKGAAHIPNGTYYLSAVTCQTGTITASGQAFSDSVTQTIVVRDDVMGVATSSGGCDVTTTGTLSYSGTTVTYSYDKASWTGGAGCPSDVAAASYSYEYIIGDDGNIGTFALDADDPNYSSSYCTSGKVGRTFEKQ